MHISHVRNCHLGLLSNRLNMRGATTFAAYRKHTVIGTKNGFIGAAPDELSLLVCIVDDC